MAQVFRASKPPPIALCEKVAVLGISVESLRQLLLRCQTQGAPELIQCLPRDDEDDELDCSKLLELVFPSGSIRFSESPHPASYEVHTLPASPTAFRVHTVKFWEFIDPIIAFRSSPIATGGPSRAQSLKVGDLTLRVPASRGSSGFVPVAVCILTRSKYYRSFRLLLESLFSYLNSVRGNLGLGHQVANAEFLRALCFLLNEAKIPPMCTQLTVQLGRKAVQFPVDYFGEPPHNEDCLLALLDLMEIDAIVSLWHLLLLEKNVIVMSRQNCILFTILEGLKSLMFPLKWAHTYIPVMHKDPGLLLAEGKTLLVGVNSEAVSFAKVARKPMEGAVYEVETGSLFVRPKVFDTICQAEVTRLKKRLIELKSDKHHFYEQANVRNDFAALDGDGEEEAWKWRLMASASEEDRDDWKMSEVREAFLRPMIDNLGNYSACFTPGRKKNVPEFDVTEFIHSLQQCGQKDCRAEDFWVALVNTRSFRQVIDSHSTCDESSVKTFGGLVDIDRSENCSNLLWHLRKCRGRTKVYAVTMKPELSPKGMYIQILKTLERKKLTPGGNKFNAFLTRGREYISDLLLTTKQHPYFSETYAEAIPADIAACEDCPHQWYGENGLLRHLALVLECCSSEDFRELNCNEEFLSRLDSDAGSCWQSLILQAYTKEALGIDALMIVRAYKAAYELNGGWVPFHRFHAVLEGVTGGEAQALFHELENSQGLLAKIARNVWMKTQDNIFEIRATSVRSSLSSPGELVSSPRSMQRLEVGVERLGRGLIRRMKRIGTVMGVVRESMRGVEIKTVPLNDRLSARGQVREGHVIAESLVATLKRILSKYRSKVENGKTAKLVKLLESDLDFKQLNDTIGELQTTKLTKTREQSPLQTLCFYLNLHNFMVLYAILYKKHTPNTALEWSKFLNLVCFIVGGERVTPNAVQTILLRAPFNQSITELATYEEIDSPGENPLTQYQLVEIEPMAHFGLFLPATFCAGLRIFTAKAVEKQLEEQARLYCRQVAIDDAQKKVTLPFLFYIKDFGGDSVMLNIVKEVLKTGEKSERFGRVVEAKDGEIELLKSPEDWRLSLRKVLHEEASANVRRH